MNDESVVRWDTKNTVFIDLFSIPKYMLEMFKTLHPEMTDVTEDDIKTVTLNPVMLNHQYNDLAFLVRDKLIIFVEAQSTWTMNILVRILMYLASTYKDYIDDRKYNVYGTKKLAMPEPEFYVIYTGGRKIKKEIISLSEDFWNNPNAKLDLRVKVICSESKSDVIGQYIIFSHVLDGQIKLHGRKKIAIEETIRICQDSDVLREYLNSRKKEVIDIMTMLFDQDYAMKVYGRTQKMKGVIETCQRFGTSITEAIHILSEDFSLTEEVASDYVHEFWRS